MFKTVLKKILPDAAAVVGLLLISFVYFFTPVTQDLILTGHDTTGGVGAGVEIDDYREKTGETTRWTNSIFGGMPTYQMAPSYKSSGYLVMVERIYQLFTPGCMLFLFVSLLGFYILMRAFNFRVWLAALGAVLWAFSSYFLIIISAGHIWKVMTLAYIPPTIAGIVLCYRGKLLWGGMVTAFFGALQIMANHIQMSYYFAFVMLFMVIAYFVEALRGKTLPAFFKGTAVVLIAGIVAIASNAPNLYHTYEYSKETMRGRAALKLDDKADAAAEQAGKGDALSVDYITQWSYGIDETWSLLVPNVKGGGSGSIMEVEAATAHDRFGELQGRMGQTYQMLQQNAPQYVNSTPGLNAYWGNQPMTVGPVYVGAIVCFLFVLGLIVVRTPMKWALLAATVLSLFIAWGKNFMPFTEFLVDYFPLYDKFRAVSSGLVIAEFAMPLLAVIALAEVLRNPSALGKNNRNLYIAFGFTGFLSLVMAFAPGLFVSLISDSEAQMFAQLSQAMGADFVSGYQSSLTAVRESIVAADAWRSFFFILAAAVLILLYRYGKVREVMLAAVLMVLCLFDLWQVDKRYLNDSMFVENFSYAETVKPSAANIEIMKDKGDYRVLNMASNTFNENETSLFHKSIGGYSAVKLRVYQDLIDHAIAPEMQRIFTTISETGGNLVAQQEADTIWPVLNMLNTKYVIVPLQNGEKVSVSNPWANGNGWFLREINYVADDRAEMRTLLTLDTSSKAVAGESQKAILGTDTYYDGSAVVKLVKYLPNELHYDIDSELGGIVVFSEVYYPGWTATVDGKEVEIGKVNYLLRAIRVNGGKHKVVFTFHPKSVEVTEYVALTALLILMHLFYLAIIKDGWKMWKEHKSLKQKQAK